MVIKSISANCQDSSLEKSNPKPINLLQNTVEVQKDTIVKVAKFDSTKIKFQIKKTVNQLVVTPKYPKLNPVNNIP